MLREWKGHQPLDQVLRERRVDGADRRHAPNERERALELRLGDQRATPVEPAEARGLPRGRGKDGRGLDPDALERQHQHAVTRHRADRHEHVLPIAALAEHPLRECNLVQTIGALTDVAGRDGFDKPRRVERVLVDGSHLPGRIVGQLAAGEHARPEASRCGLPRHAAGVDGHAHQRHREIVRRVAERQLAHMPIPVGIDACRPKHLESFEPQRRVRYPEPKRERTTRRVQLTDGVEEVCDAPVAQLEQAQNERLRMVHFFADDGLPQRNRVVSTRRHDTARVDMKTARERREDGR